MSLNQIPFRVMGGPQQQETRGDSAWNITNYLLAFKLERLDCWRGKNTVRESSSALKEWLSAAFQVTNAGATLRGTQQFILGSFFFFLEVFLQVIHEQDHSGSTTGALICNSNSMWTTLTSSGDAVTFDSHSKTPQQLLLKRCLSSIQVKNSSCFEMQVIYWCFNYVHYII